MTGERGAVGSYVKEAIAARYPSAEFCHIDTPRIDLRDRPDVRTELLDKGWFDACDVIVLGAATRLGTVRPRTLLTDDVAMTANVLSAVKPHGHIVYLSSATVYSGPGHNGCYEEEEQASHPFELRPTPDSVGFAKLACERAVKQHAASVGATHTIWRLHNVITPREQHGDPAHVQVRLFADMVISQLSVIQMVGDGFDHRCWTWVGDVASAIAEHLHTDMAADRMFNLGSGVPCSVRRLAHTMLRVAKELGYVPASYTPTIQWAPGNARPTPYPSSQLAELRLGFQAPTMLEDCMRKFLRGKMPMSKDGASPDQPVSFHFDASLTRIASIAIGGTRYVPDKSVTDTDTWAAQQIAAAQAVDVAPAGSRDDEIDAWRRALGRSLGPVIGERFMAEEFVECDACRAKPGTPALCAGCLANRYNMGRRP